MAAGNKSKEQRGLLVDKKVLDANLRRVEDNLRQEIRDLDTNKLRTNINRLPYIIAGAAIVALMGGVVGGLIRLFVR